ncbi:SemiSWEET family sugar transporter [Bradyrhizobium genosp. P]|uniref:SemiSWEET family sugar transporter n=1 Tax=Bradyrhizobium genosp. P TaxID=83641 RepID=UPI003CFAE2D2
MASVSYVPRGARGVARGSTRDLSLGTLAALTLGLSLWVIYGALRGDWVIVSANVVGTALAAIVLGCKIRDSG